MRTRKNLKFETFCRFLDPEWLEANYLSREDVAGFLSIDLGDYEDWARDSGDLRRSRTPRGGGVSA